MTSIAFATATATAAYADEIAAVKITKRDVAGEIFLRKDAIKIYRDDYIDTDVPTFTSKDASSQTGFYKSGPFREYFNGPDGYPKNEFAYFISGSETLTSTDGSVIVVNSGEGVTIPKGWTGTLDTPGFTKIYAIESPDGKL